MRYLLALICPPLALLLCGRPVSAIINALWIVLIVIGTLVTAGIAGVILIPSYIFPVLHAILIVAQTIGDERQVALITAMTGKPPPPRSGEWSLFNVLFILAFLAFGGLLATGFFARSEVRPRIAPVMATQTKPAPPPQAPSPPSITGWTMAEVVATYGEPISKDATTATAVWTTPTARFAAKFDRGKVVEVISP